MLIFCKLLDREYFLKKKLHDGTNIFMCVNYQCRSLETFFGGGKTCFCFHPSVRQNIFLVDVRDSCS